MRDRNGLDDRSERRDLAFARNLGKKGTLFYSRCVMRKMHNEKAAVVEDRRTLISN